MEDCELEATRLKGLVDRAGVDLELKGYFCLIEELIRNFEFQGKSMSRKYSQRPESNENFSQDDNVESSLVKLVPCFLHLYKTILNYF